MFIKNVLYKLKTLIEKLKSKELNIIDASNLIESTIKSLENINKDCNRLDAIIDAALILSKKMDLDPVADFNKLHRKRLIPKRVDSDPTTTRLFFKIILQKRIQTSIRYTNKFNY